MMSQSGSNQSTTITVQLKTSAVVLVGAFICQCIGIGTNFWSFISFFSNGEYRMGLWRVCACFSSIGMYGSSNSKNCVCSAPPSSKISGWLKAVQAMEVIGLILLFLLCVLILIQLCSKQSQKFKSSGVLLSLFGGMCILIGVTIYGVEHKMSLHYSFVLCTVAGILMLLCTFLLVADRKKTLWRSTETQNQQTTPYTPQGQTVSYIINSSPQTTGYPAPSYAPAQFAPPPSYESVTNENGQNPQMTFYGAPPSYAEIQNKSCL
ncbi:hypothetical protein ACF0H5_010759 [Mactra antiquata]